MQLIQKKVFMQDFGQDILQWIPYGQSVTFNNFKDEIINNLEHSTISAETYSEYEC